MTDFNLATYTLQILAPYVAVVEEGLPEGVLRVTFRDSDKRVLANLPAYVESWQEDMSDLLPEGYEVKIVEAMT